MRLATILALPAIGLVAATPLLQERGTGSLTVRNPLSRTLD